MEPGPGKRLLLFHPHRSGREAGSLPCPRLTGGGPHPSPLVEGAAPDLPPDSGLSITQRRTSFSTNWRGRSPHNQCAFWPHISRKWGSFSNPGPAHTNAHFKPTLCRYTPAAGAVRNTCSGVACSPLSPPPMAAWAWVPPLGAGAPHRWEGAQKGKQSLAHDSAKSHSQQRLRAEVTLVQIRSGGATRKEATRKRWKTQAQAALLLFLTRSRRRPNNSLDCAHSTGGTQRECSLRSAG